MSYADLENGRNASVEKDDEHRLKYKSSGLTDTVNSAREVVRCKT